MTEFQMYFVLILLALGFALAWIGLLILAVKFALHYFRRFWRMLQWFESIYVENKTPERERNMGDLFNDRVKTGKAGKAEENEDADKPPPKDFWDDIDQLEKERENLENGMIDHLTIDPLDHTRRVYEAIADLKDKEEPPLRQ